MKKIKNIGKILFVVIVLQFLGVSCPDYWLVECPPDKFHYIFSDINVQNIDNAEKHPIIIENEKETILKEAFGIRVILNLELSDSVTLFDCIPVFKDTIISIKVFTVNDFDNEFSADSDVSELFKVLYDSLPHITSILPKYIPIDEYIRRHSTPLVYPYSPRNENIESIIDLYLMKPPEFIGEHNFRVEVLLSEGKIFLATTPRINLE